MCSNTVKVLKPNNIVLKKPNIIMCSNTVKVLKTQQHCVKETQHHHVLQHS